MSDPNSLHDRIVAALRAKPDIRFTAREIAEALVTADPAWAQKKRDRSRQGALQTNDSAFLSQIVAEIGARNPALEVSDGVKTTEDRPRRYYFTAKSDSAEIEDAEDPPKPAIDPTTSREGIPAVDLPASEYTEASLYPLLSRFLAESLSIYSKRIDETRSRNDQGRSGNKWLHPDLIGFEILSRSWVDTVSELAAIQSDRTTRLWSFEVKKIVNRANVREVFFQTVSNSSWANFGYLVATEVTGKGTMDELRVLSNQHGIGLIQLDRPQPAESFIQIPAAERRDVDWAAASRLAEQNPDAAAVFEHVRYFYQTRNPQPRFWDHRIGN